MVNTKKERSNTKIKKTALEEYLRQLPLPPEEHAHELKMEKQLKRLFEDGQEKLSDSELQFYSRQIMLDKIGYKGQLKLKNSKVCIIGLGGLGSTIAIQLTAMGIGHIRLVDRDIVEESNLQRQHLYNYDLLGFPKVEAATKTLEKINPHVKLEPLPLSLTERNAGDILNGIDTAVDGLDNMDTRYALNRACVELGIPYVFGSAISTFGNASTIIPRKTACLVCFYGNLDDRVLPACGTMGIHPSVLGVVASIEAAETVKILLERQPSLSNKLLYCDIDSTRFEEIEVAKTESCPICGSRPKTSPKPLRHVLIEESCGRKNRRVFLMVPRENLNLKIKELIDILTKKGMQFKVKAKLGTTFETRQGLIASILKSGILIIEGANSRKEVLDFYKELVVDKMRISWSRIQ
ncbi:MAG: HesA/MoeB/ThiF family protein [Candidatus Bathyarchaeota archaeon]|nr:MAG: HesA/MoeB/ThiF family protein [Candidatus Bathyarchaeota archaeon]